MKGDARERDCRLVQVAADGGVVLSIDGHERHVEIAGVSPEDQPAAERLEMLGRLKGLPLRCTDTRHTRDGRAVVRLHYLAWRDKSGDVWRDVADALQEPRAGGD